MRKSILIAVCIMFSVVALAQEKSKKMKFEVDGVCEMCKNRIEKAALGVKGVKYAMWDIPSHELSLIVDERKTNAMAIKTALAKAGHDTKELKATDEAYDNLAACCHYRDNDNEHKKEHHK